MIKSIKQITPIITNSTVFDKIVALLENTGRERGNLLRVLTYHRVDEPSVNPWLDPGLISASPEAFETQMKYLSANYQVVSVLDVLEAFENKGQKILPPRAVLVTFDDAYCDFEKHAWPVLKQYSIPVTLFVSTSFPDHPERLFWWDRLFHAIHTTLNGELNTPIGLLSISTTAQRDQAYTRLKNYMKTLPKGGAMAEVDRICSELEVSPHDNCVLGWDSLRKLASEGVILGAHTQTHPIMNHISFSDMQNEALGSLRDLQREIGVVPPIFAYPSGIYSQEVVKAVECAGFRLAFTTERGINEISSADPMLLQRINIGTRTTMSVLRAQLLSWSASLYPLSKKIFS